MDHMRDLITRGWISSSKYLSSIQSGTEIFTGTGRLDTTGYYCRIQKEPPHIPLATPEHPDMTTPRMIALLLAAVTGSEACSSTTSNPNTDQGSGGAMGGSTGSVTGLGGSGVPPTGAGGFIVGPTGAGGSNAPVQKLCATKTTVMNPALINFETYDGMVTAYKYGTAFGGAAANTGPGLHGTVRGVW